jgi:uncharacterized protein
VAPHTSMRYYNDVVHGRQIRLTSLQEDLIDHPALLQLNGKRQLGLTGRIYRNATHSRYEHSIGAMFVAARLAECLGLGENQSKLLQAAAALHDIGHYPFSHAAESVLPLHHEQVPQIVLRGDDFGALAAEPIMRLLQKHCIEPLAVAEVLAGTHELSPLISNAVVDADRLDYLPRDLLMCNVAFGAEIDRIVEQLTFRGGKVGINSSGVASITAFLVARSLAYDQIYLHPKVQVAETMLQYAVKHEPALASNAEELAEAIRIASRVHAMSESELMELLAQSSNPLVAELARRVRGPISGWYHSLYSLGGEVALPLVRRLYSRREELEADCLGEGFLVSWFITSRVLKARSPPHVPVTDGTSLYDRAIPRATFAHVPDHLFAIYGKTGSAEEKALAEKIVLKFA